MKAPKTKNVFIEALKRKIKGFISSATGENLTMLEMKEKVNSMIDKANNMVDQSIKIETQMKFIERKRDDSKTEEAINKYNALLEQLKKAFDMLEIKHKDMVEKIESVKEKLDFIEVQNSVGECLALESIYINDDNIKSLVSDIEKIEVESEVIFNKVLK